MTRAAFALLLLCDVAAAAEPAELWKQADERLRALDGAGAAQSLEALLAIDGNDVRARELLSALLSSRDPKRSKALSRGLTAPPPLPVPALPRPPETGQAFIADVPVRLRDVPLESFTKKRQTVSIGTPVTILKRNKKGWAWVRAGLDRTWSVLVTRGPNGVQVSAPEVVPSFFQQNFQPGWLRVEHLTGVQPTLAELEQAREKAAAEKKLDEAVVWASRAQQMAPTEARLAVLVGAALDAGRWTLAGQLLAVPLAEQRPAYSLSSLEFSWGCTLEADPRITEVFDQQAPLPPLTCVSLGDIARCRACDWRGVRADAAEADLKAMERARKGLRRDVPSGPWLRVRHDPAEVPAGEKVYVSSTQPNGQKLVDLFELPPVTPKVKGAFVEVWFKVSEEEGLRFDLFFAADEATAKAEAEQRAAAKGEAALSGVVFSVQRPPADCICGRWKP